MAKLTDKQRRNIIIGGAILLLLFWITKISKKTNGNGNGNGKFRCDAGGCLECHDFDHPNCMPLEECKLQCESGGGGLSSTFGGGGGTDPTQLNYDPNANTPCAYCCIPIIYGCNDPSAVNHYLGVSQGYGCSTKNPNDRTCCRYMGINGQIYSG